MNEDLTSESYGKNEYSSFNLMDAEHGWSF